MKVGFTGTREGMADAQFVQFRQWFSASGASEFHHGACVGADSDAVEVIHDSHRKRVRITAHPSNIPQATATDAIDRSELVLDPKPPLDRNRDIVDACEVLIACPKGPEELRSGTWATVRWARKQGKRIVIVWPDGEVTEERPAVTPPGAPNPAG